MNKYISVSVAVALLCVVSSVAAFDGELPMRCRGGDAWARREVELLNTQPDAVPAQWFTQKLNHSDPNSPTFQQRFFVNDAYFNGTGPVFLGIRGEGPISGPPGGWVNELAQKHNALSISVEHRFYGESVPDKNFSVANLLNLNLHDVLLDYVSFIDAYKKNINPSLPWFTFGGSYSGALSAFFRIKYSDYTVGSLSSSGVVNTIYDFVQFDEQVAESAGPACADVLRQTTAAVEAMEPVAARQLFGSPIHMSDPDFFYMVADSMAQSVQYGHDLELCSTMQSAAARKADLAKTFANFTTFMWGSGFASNCFYDTQCLINDPSQWQPTSRAWRWQKCYQMAYLQAAPAQGSIRSSCVTLEALVDQCHQIFGDAVDPQKGSAAVIAEFGGANPQSSNIFFSQGGADPWQRAGVRKTLSPSMPAYIAQCKDCGHCGDLFAPTASTPTVVKTQQSMEATYISQWLAAASA